MLQRQANINLKQGAEGKVQDVKEKISKTKQKVKELKQRSKKVGDTLDNGHDFFEEMKKLEHERDGSFSRRHILE